MANELTRQVEELRRENQSLSKAVAQLRAAAETATRRAELAEASARRAWSLAPWGARQR